LNLENTRQLIREQLAVSQNPVVACSFGKDAIVLLHLCLQERKVPVLYFKLPKFQEKNTHAYQVMREWDLEVFEQLPYTTSYIQIDGEREVFELYRTGRQSFLLLAISTKPRDGDRYLCAIDDLFCRPHAAVQDYPWDVTFIGHKACDPLKFFSDSGRSLDPVMDNGHTRQVFPLADWTDADIWAYIHEHKLPYDRARYELGDLRGSPDHYPTCMDCLDSATVGQPVMCPKQKTMIPSNARDEAYHKQFLEKFREVTRYIHAEQPEGVS